MGRFFNEVIMPMKKIPLNKKRQRDSLEGLRTKFNEEHETEQAPLYVSDKDRAKAEEEANVEAVHSEESTEAGITSPPGDEQSQSGSDIPPGRSGPKRVRRISKGVIAETRHNK